MPHLYRPQMTIQSNSYTDKDIRKSIGRDGKSYAPGTFVRVRHPQFNALGKPIKIETVCSPGTYRLTDKTNVNARRLYTTSQSEILPPPVASVQYSIPGKNTG